MYCQKCGKDEPLPFRCPFCGRYFCPEHRLPEAHDCTEAWKTKIPRQPEVIYTSAPEPSYSVQYSWTEPGKRPTFWFSPTEIRQVIIGLALVSAVGISMPLGVAGIDRILPTLSAVGLFTLGFILHELAHKFTAQAYGLWAEFRLTTIGVVITAISVFSPIKFIAPGMVLISGQAANSAIGRISLSGPLTNLALGSIALLGYFVAPVRVYQQVFALGCWVNTYMALFNLIPFGEFDGLKIFRWNKAVWGIVLALAIALLAYANTIAF